MRPLIAWRLLECGLRHVFVDAHFHFAHEDASTADSSKQIQSLVVGFVMHRLADFV